VIERTFTTPGPLRLDLSIPSGSIEVDTADGEETHVELTASNERDLDDARVELRERRGGHELVVCVDRTRGLLGGVRVFNGGGRYSLRVRCPRGADLVVRTASADVDARGSFGAGDVVVVTGRATLGAFAGDVAVKTVSGDVTLESAGGKLTAQTVSGAVEIGEAAAGGTTKSVSGDVRLVVGAGEVSATSVSGDIEVAIRSGAQLHVDANSVSGTLDTEVPLGDVPGDGGDGPAVDVRARTVSGDFRIVRA
jgi:DUF4097 and DUF4098 domain-containing protein YvlB